MSDARAREQRLVFGEVASDYDRYRPSYPDALFDAVIEYGDLHPGDRAVEIGAGTGKATAGFAGRGLRVHALEPDPAMAAALRAKDVEVEETLFEQWSPPEPQAFDLAYAAQSWHWVLGDDRFERLARAVCPGATVALFWNQGRPHPEPFRTENDAAYDRLAPEMVHLRARDADTIDGIADGLVSCAAFTGFERVVFTWEHAYSRDEWVHLLGTHSDHRMLPEDRRRALHASVAAAIDHHGGRLDVVYDTVCLLSRRS